MPENTPNQTTNLIVVTEQLEQLDIIEKALKKKLTLNTYTTNNILELKKIISNEAVDVVIVDDAESTLGVGSVRTALNDLHLSTPILQLEHRAQGTPDANFIRNGASIVCAHDDSVAILHNTQLLIAYSRGQSMLKDDQDTIGGYREKFQDLYKGLADPICYVHDGVFLDCNPAFLRTFEVSDKDELDELTILNFVDRKQHSDFKNHLRKSTRRDMSANPILFSMLTKLGKSVEFTMMSKPTKYEDEDAVQIYLRSASEGGGGAAVLFDASTGLSNREQMGFFLEQKRQHLEQQGGQGFLAYLIIHNYRDVWGTDGFEESEKFIKAIAGTVRKTLPVRTEASRYTDDGLLLFIPNNDAKEVERMLIDLVRTLDKLTPDNMVRMVEPMCYVAYDHFTKDSKDHLMLTSILFRSARGIALSEGSTRVCLPTSTEVSKNDERRLELIQSILKEETMQLLFQPIVSFAPDGKRRYRERLSLFHESEPDLEMDVVIGTAERYDMMHHIDKWKINQLLDLLLGIPQQTRENLLVFILLSADALKNNKFLEWLIEQMEHTGLGGEHFVFEMTTDNVIGAYSGALRLSKAVRDCGAQIAVSKIGTLSAENERILNDIQPDIIKLDIREIDTLDDREEEETMTDICAKAKDINAVIIAEYIESPAQLARVWPYGVVLVQGDSITPKSENFDFDFSEFALK